MQVGRTRHHANLFVALIGASSRSRKGSIRDVAVDLVALADPQWGERGILSGATSGEGIVAAVRDPTHKRRRATKAEKNDIALTHDIDAEGYIDEVVDEGVADKRVVFDEAELSSVFKVAARDGSTLSERFRHAYDSGTDMIVNKSSPMRVTGAHISINGHSTAEEVRARLSELDAANGWGNRFLYVATKRTRRLPIHAIADIRLVALAEPLRLAVDWAHDVKPRMIWSSPAEALWRTFYAAVPDDVLGLVGALTSRSEAHVMRVALIFAVADRAESITAEHLRAALAVWRYCEESVGWVWDEAIGNPTADAIRTALHAAGRAGMSRTAIRDKFSHDRRAQSLDDALTLLADRGQAVTRQISTPGRPAAWWWHHEHAEAPTGTERDERDRSPAFGPFAPDASRSTPNGKATAEPPKEELA